jgi:hypothetical protein
MSFFSQKHLTSQSFPYTVYRVSFVTVRFTTVVTQFRVATATTVSVNTLHERKLCTVAGQKSEQFFVSVHCAYFVITGNILMWICEV